MMDIFSYSTISVFHEIVVRNCTFQSGVGKSDDAALSYRTLLSYPNVLSTPVLFSKQDMPTQKVLLLADDTGGSDRVFFENSFTLHQRPALLKISFDYLNMRYDTNDM